jgi:colanic acid biosynthesis glycosyl transferase WcaI
VPKNKVHVVPVWSLDRSVFFDLAGREGFRRQLGVETKFVVMYSGNHSPLHPLDTLLYAARELRDHAQIVFVFVGGGSEFARVKGFAGDNDLSNIICVPYQPLEQLAASLSAADLQVVLLGDSFVGIVHPSKIYNMLAVGSPFLYIGPEESHITDLRQYSGIARMGGFFRHGDVEQVVKLITTLAVDFKNTPASRPGRPDDLDCFAQGSLMPSMLKLVEAMQPSEGEYAR